MDEDDEMVDAFVAFALATGDPLSDDFIDVITHEIRARGHHRCQQCGRTMRQHVLAALHSGGRHLGHRFISEREQ